MKSKILKEEAKKLRAEGHIYKEISQKLNINLFCARHMYTYHPMSASKVGPKYKLQRRPIYEPFRIFKARVKKLI